jgi:hypothetical protein
MENKIDDKTPLHLRPDFEDICARFFELNGEALKQGTLAAYKRAKREGLVDTEKEGCMTPLDVAKVCHEANKALCESQGDTSQVSWAKAPMWQRQSAVSGVTFNLENPDAPASASHDNWLKEKKIDGWIYGPIKDESVKTHPCCVPYSELPVEQQAKDHLFKVIVGALGSLCGV